MADAPILADWTEAGISPGADADPEPPIGVTPSADVDAAARALVEMERRYPPPDMDQVRADWLWVVEQTPTGEFDRYRGLTVAVHRGQVLGASDQPLHLELEVARRLKVHPAQLVMAYIELSRFH